MLRSDLEYAFEDAACVCTDLGLGLGSPSPGPEPGPQLPQKKKPKIL